MHWRHGGLDPYLAICQPIHLDIVRVVQIHATLIISNCRIQIWISTNFIIIINNNNNNTNTTNNNGLIDYARQLEGLCSKVTESATNTN